MSTPVAEVLCAWCRRPESEHGPAGEKPLGGPDDRLCPVPGVSSQFFTPPPRPVPARGGLTESDLLFAVRVLEGRLWPSLEYDADHPVARERAAVSARYQGLKRTLGSDEASRLARAEWLGRFLAEREGPGRRADELEVLLAWESGELSEGQACRLIGGLAAAGTTDPVTARGMREAALAAARKRWERWRASNPPSPGSGP